MYGLHMYTYMYTYIYNYVEYIYIYTQMHICKCIYYYITHIPMLRWFNSTREIHEVDFQMLILHLGGGFKQFFFFTPIWGRFPFWRAYFSDGLKLNHQPDIFSLKELTLRCAGKNMNMWWRRKDTHRLQVDIFATNWGWKNRRWRSPIP